jgi:DNA-binding HxlR family transcriptional regulator
MAKPIQSCARLRPAVELLGKRWTLLIVELLLQRPARFCELGQALPQISERVLSERLRELTDTGLATREVDPGPPIAATYALTRRGRGLEPVIEALRTWSARAPAAPTGAARRRAAGATRAGS